MEEIVNKWTAELESATKEFSRQAQEVAAWDSVLRKGGDEISRLMAQLQAAEERQTSIEQTLDYVEQQQTDLESLLDGYEAQVNLLLEGAAAAEQGGILAHSQYGGSSQGQGGQAGGDHQSIPTSPPRKMEMGAADAERERAFATAEMLNSQLDELSRNLSAMIVDVNQLSSSSSQQQQQRRAAAVAGRDPTPSLLNSGAAMQQQQAHTEDAVAQIVAILNAHLGSLKWIDEAASKLREKVEKLRRGQVANHSNSNAGNGAFSASTPAASNRAGSVLSASASGLNLRDSIGPDEMGSYGRAGSRAPSVGLHSSERKPSAGYGGGNFRASTPGRSAGAGWSEASVQFGGGSSLGRSRGYGL